MKTSIVLGITLLILFSGAALAGKAKYRVYCPEHAKIIKYGNDKSKLEQYSRNHNVNGHTSYVENHG